MPPFDAVLEAEDMKVLLSVPQAPRMHAHCERVIGTIRREVLNRILIVNEAHAHQVHAEYQEHYNTDRPHRSRDQRPPEAQEHRLVLGTDDVLGHAPTARPRALPLQAHGAFAGPDGAHGARPGVRVDSSRLVLLPGGRH
ncbi:integrase core domain-containing protein [Streptomyces sp. NPDC091412]|uniref:integrase core domain-containing protein n=1 Tax=Streptomyces sp. NPDC091412 TaxID=3366002 RepID=UPI0037FD38B8